MPLLNQTQDGDKSYEQQSIPTFDELKGLYGKRWAREKEKFQTQLML